MKNSIFMKTAAGIPALAGCIGAFYLGFFRKWMTTWGATAEEHAMALAGDDLIEGGVRAPVNMTQAITIDAPPEKVWPWLAQIGQEQAGFYSFDKLERFLGFDIRNVYRIVPQWQDIKAGDFRKFHQCGIGMRVVDVEKNRHLVMLTDSNKRQQLEPGQMELLPPADVAWHVAWNWSFNLVELPGGKTRFLVRGLARWDRVNPVVDLLLDFFGGVPSCLMQMQMLRELKELAEGNHPVL